MKKLTVLLVLFFLSLFNFFLFSQSNSIIILKDGREYKGKLISIKENDILFQIDGRLNFFKRESVWKINFQKKRDYENVKNISEIKDNEIVEIWSNSLKWQSQENNFVVLLDKTTYNFKDEKSVTIRMKKAIKILSMDGKDESIQYFYYLKKYFNVNLLYAISITEDGSVFPVSESAINDEPLNGNYPIYDNLHRVKFGLKNSDIGTTIIWECELTGTYDEIENPFFIRKQLVNSYPVEKRIIEITAPKKINLSYSFYSGLIYYKTSHPVIKIQNDTTIFNFTENSIAEYVNDEENCPDDTLLYPSININFNTTFQNIAANYYERYFTKNLDEKTVNKLNEIIKDKKDNLEKVVSIYNYINRQIKLAGINLNENVYSPNETSRIIEASALNNLDKNYLFTKMVNYIGINAKMLFYKRNNKNGIIDKTPSLKQFDDVVTVVSVQNQDFIASFEDENYSFGQCDFDLINAECIDVSSKKSNTENIKNVNSKENQIITSYICKIYDDDSLEMEKTTAVKGIYQTDFRGKRFLSNEELSKWIKNRASNFGNDTSVIKYKFINNLNNFNEDVVLYENFLVKDYAISSGKNIKIFHLPGFNYSASKVNKNDRKFPFDLESISKNILNYEIIIPDSYKVKYIPKSEEFTNEYFTFKYNSNIIDNKILISIDLEYNKRVVPNNLYLELKKYMESLAKLSNEWFIFEKQ